MYAIRSYYEVREVPRHDEGQRRRLARRQVEPGRDQPRPARTRRFPRCARPDPIEARALGEAPLEAGGDHLGAQRLAGVRRVDHQRLASEVLLFVLFGVDPFLDPLDLLDRGLGHFLDRITSYNVCYTKLLREKGQAGW